jgi:hypothetical protein
MKPKNDEINSTNMAQVLGDVYSNTILRSTHIKPKTAIEISEAYGIPIAACYRRIRVLESMGLLRKEERLLTQRGKRIWNYLSNVHQFEIFYRDGKVIAKCELRNGYINHFYGEDSIEPVEV